MSSMVARCVWCQHNGPPIHIYNSNCNTPQQVFYCINELVMDRGLEMSLNKLRLYIDGLEVLRDDGEAAAANVTLGGGGRGQLGGWESCRMTRGGDDGLLHDEGDGLIVLVTTLASCPRPRPCRSPRWKQMG
jgi:hypothetical protein